MVDNVMEHVNEQRTLAINRSAEMALARSDARAANEKMQGDMDDDEKQDAVDIELNREKKNHLKVFMRHYVVTNPHHIAHTRTHTHTQILIVSFLFFWYQEVL